MRNATAYRVGAVIGYGVAKQHLFVERNVKCIIGKFERRQFVVRLQR